ncbi:MAG: xanthine dehydrogenase family protein molybdopterin-binding subunit, partial [Clostridiales Family XIII bacterium]|nr:xanthine dehydrogenase family protein molybdopterin-binding subunit [Clostridiales Family XIII bacterium]
MTDIRCIGKSEIRKDALDKVTGSGVYTADVHPKGMLYGKILGSAVAHGVIKRIDTSKAEALPGVVSIITGRDAPDARIDGYIHDRHILCKEKARYAGDPVAAVAATSEAIAEEALRLIEVEYEALPAVFDPVIAYRKDCAAVVHQDVQSY